MPYGPSISSQCLGDLNFVFFCFCFFFVCVFFVFCFVFFLVFVF